MDPATASAIAALVVAALAFLVAFAQSAQQYFITGQLIRLCDRVVFGDLPGHGRRVWEMSQLRFRVVYEIPQIGIAPELWPSSATASLARRETTLGNVIRNKSKSASPESSLLPLTIEEPTLRRPWLHWLWKTQSLRDTHPGEASWASFIRAVYPSCHKSTFLSLLDGDADRCPTDLQTVPMPASLRNTVIRGLMAGMECTAASFERGSLSMQGMVGTITSAQHPILGPIIHFSPRTVDGSHGIGIHGHVSKDWLRRVMDTCVVAGRYYNKKERQGI